MPTFFDRIAKLAVLLASLTFPSQAATSLYILGGQAPFKSSDNGDTWQPVVIQVNSGLLQGVAQVFAMTTDPGVPSTIYATGRVSGANAFMKSLDGGASWTANLVTGFNFYGFTIDDPKTGSLPLVTDSVRGNQLYSSVSTPKGLRFARSSDSGNTWSISELPPNPLYSVTSNLNGTPLVSFTVDPIISGLVYAVSASVIFKSTDFGATWTILTSAIFGNGPAISQITVDPRDSRTMFAALDVQQFNCPSSAVTGCGLWKSSDGGVTWIDTQLNSNDVGIQAFGTPSNIVFAGANFAGTGPSVLRSTDSGATWAPIKNNFQYTKPILRTDPESGFVYAFDRKSLLRSRDGGTTWTTLPTLQNCLPSDRFCSYLLFPTDFLILRSVASKPPAILTQGVVNGASYQPIIQANSWAAISGTDLATKTDTWDKFIVNGAFPTILDEVSVTVGNEVAFLNYISPTQINFLVPQISAADLKAGTTKVTVINLNGTSKSVTAAVSASAPGMFQWPGNQAVATRQNFTLAAKNGTFLGTTTTPAKSGEVIILWGTGFGPTVPSAPFGKATPSDVTYNAATLPVITLNDTPVKVYGAALTAGFAGLFQIAIQIPPNLVPGDYTVRATVGATQSVKGPIISILN